MNKAMALSVSLAIFAAGCATPAEVIVSSDYSAQHVKRVALVDFTDFPQMVGSGDIAAGIFEKYLLQAGYQSVDRNQVQAVMREQNLQIYDNSDSQTLAKLAKALNVDALAFGQVNDYSDSQEQTVVESVPVEQSDPIFGKNVEITRANGAEMKSVQDVVTGYSTTESEQTVQDTETTPAHVALSVRLVSGNDGEVLWSASSSSSALHLTDATELASSKLMKAVKDEIKE